MTKKELIADRDDWQKIAEMNSEFLNNLRADIHRLESYCKQIEELLTDTVMEEIVRND